MQLILYKQVATGCFVFTALLSSVMASHGLNRWSMIINDRLWLCRGGTSGGGLSTGDCRRTVETKADKPVVVLVIVADRLVLLPTSDTDYYY